MMRFRREMGGIAAGAAIAALALGQAAADDFATDWARSAKSEARLVAGGPNLAAVQIRLAPNAITYWRDPGDAGVPPTFDFSGSTNVASVEPVFPAPTRIREADGSQAFGWSGGVTIPLRIKPKDAAKCGNAQDACQLCRLRKALPAGGGEALADASRKALARGGPRRSGARRVAARGRAEGARRDRRGRRRRLALLCAPRSRAAARSLRRAAGWLVGDERACAG